MSILIQNCSYLVCNSSRIERDCDILLDGNRIHVIGRNISAPAGAEVIQGRDCVVMPGLINAHTHLYQNLMKGISPGISLVPWCNDVLFPALDSFRVLKDRFGSRLPYLWTAIASIEMIRGGITCCVNMDAVSPEIVHAWETVGFRGVLAYTLSNKWVPAELRAEESRMKQQMLEFIQNHHHPEGLTTVQVAPSTLFLCTDDFLCWAGEQAKEYDLGMQIHVAEIKGEVEDQIRETDRTPVGHLAHLGLLDERLSAVHSVHLTQEDIGLLAQSGTQVVHCPKSNMKLADGIAPITSLRQKGIPVSLGTDGCASNDLLDMWEEMRAAVLLARVAENQADAMLPEDAFSMATSAAAHVARIPAGELQVGMLADLAVVELSGMHLRPFHDEDLFNSLVFCGKACDVRDTIINGEVVMRDRKIIKVDELALIEEAESIAAELSAVRKNHPYIG